MKYLSPAFTSRSEQDLEFLSQLHGDIGFGLFWIDVIRPMIEKFQARALLEIGADQGQNTRLLIDHCKSFGGQLTVVEPFVSDALRELTTGIPNVRLLEDKSQNALRAFTSSFDAILLEGDLNYAAVSDDLRLIAELANRDNSPFPLLFIKNMSWMYALRDMYYDATSMEPASRHPAECSGITPWDIGLVPGKINSNFQNATQEGGPRNGVLAAVNDFLTLRPDLALFRIPYNFGVGVIYKKGSPVEQYIKEELQPPPSLGRLIETFEIARINEIIRKLESPAPLPMQGAGIRSRIVRAVRRIGGAILRRLDS